MDFDLPTDRELVCAARAGNRIYAVAKPLDTEDGSSLLAIESEWVGKGALVQAPQLWLALGLLLPGLQNGQPLQVDCGNLEFYLILLLLATANLFLLCSFLALLRLSFTCSRPSSQNCPLPPLQHAHAAHTATYKTHVQTRFFAGPFLNMLVLD